MLRTHSVSPSRMQLEVATSTKFTLLPEAIPPETVLYFHGKLTREQAEQLLISHKATEGLFLLRESVNGNYVISICHMNRVHHYNVERQPDGYYKIQTGRRFVGPVELVKHHSEHLDGFLTLARTPLNIPDGCSPLVLQGVPLDELEQKLRLKAVEMGLKGPSVNEALNGPMRDHLRHLVFKELHVCQPWYHHQIRRREAEHRLAEDGNYEGSFLVRFRREDATFVLSLCSQCAPKHYKIEERLGRWSIEGGQYFETLIEMIDHYHHRQDGLLCKLRRPVIAPSFTRSRSGSSTGTPFTDVKARRLKEDSAVQTGNGPGEISAWNGSHSLPSLCHTPLVTTSISSRANVPRAVQNDLTQPKQDLISFADWPNVTKLLSEQTHPCGSINRGTLTNPSDQLPVVPFTPETPVPNPATQITPTPGSMFLFPNESPFVGPVCSFDTAGTGRLLFVTGKSDSTFNPPLWSSPSKTVSTVDQSCLKPIQPGDSLCVSKIGAEVDALVRDALNRSSTAWQTFTTSSVQNAASKTGETIDSTPSITNPPESQQCGIVFHRLPTEPVPSRALSSETQPTHSLHFDPILDTPWEEPECSEEHSTPSSDGGVFLTNDAHSSNNNINNNTFIGGTNNEGSTAIPLNVPTNPFLPTFNPSPGRQPLTNKTGMTTVTYPVAQTGRTPNQTFTSVSLAHSPDVTTFCSAACCTQTAKGSTVPRSITVAHADSDQALCERKMQRIYDELPLSHSLLNPECITLKERLGGGNFGYVVKGLYRTPSGQEVPVAVKTLKPNQITNAGEREILAEARTMAQLKHRHIVRLIGVCKEDKFMLVLELAPLGPINKYLKKRPDIPVHTLTELMHQVAMGMAYLESCKFVHRDLAARNVLLVTNHFAKISDFGMSKALNFGSDYYRAASAGKWPLKWYAPECIYYFRFDSKSDVWSYGITLWEVYSYGERPYRDMKGAQILAMLDQGLRLSRPSRCPESIYSLMQQCWNFEGVRRPTFAELVLALSRILRVMPQPNSSCITSDETETTVTIPPQASDNVDPMYSQSKRANCSGSGGSGVNSGASDGPPF